MAYSNTFKRVEIKYLLDSERYLAMRKALEQYMTVDTYGEHTICNIYCDTDSSYLIWHSLDKPRYKEKLRLRSYGTPKDDDGVFLEIKKKYKGIVYKRRVSLPFNAAQTYLNGGEKPLESQIMNEIDYMKSFYGLSPKLFLAYDRIALFGKEDNEFRLTFDFNIRSRTSDLDLSHGDYGEKLMEDGYYVMEIKTVGGMPMWMTEILSENEIYPTSFSKYGQIYSKVLNEYYGLSDRSDEYEHSNVGHIDTPETAEALELKQAVNI